MKQVAITLACLSVAAMLAYHWSHNLERRQASAKDFDIVAMSGARLAAILEGLPAHSGRRRALTFAPPRSCSASLAGRVARWIGLDRAVHAQDDNPCEAYQGVCVGCPSDSKPGGIELDYGTCNGFCTGSAGYTIPIPDDNSTNGYQYTGRLTCNRQDSCPCSLSYCHDCTPGS